MKTLVLLMAAGKSQRFEGIKQLADINGIPMLVHSIGLYRKGDAWLNGIDEVSVVLGSNSGIIQAVLPPDVSHYFAPCWENGMGASIADAIVQVPSHFTHVLIGLADQIALDPTGISKLLAASRLQPRHIVAAKYQQTIGAPAIFPKRFFSQLATLVGDKGASSIIRQHIDECAQILMPSASQDIDYPKQLIDYLISVNK